MKDLQTKIDTLSGSIKAIDKEFEVRTKIEKYKEMGIGIEYDKKDPNMNYKLKQLERAFGVENSRQDQIAALENLQNKGVSFANPIFETIVTPTNGISLQPAIGQGNLSIYTNASGMEIRRPIPLTPADVVTSRPDDKRLNPVHGNIAQHTGTDYGISTGTKLGSVMEGKVVSVDIDPKAFLNVADGGTHNGASVTIESKHAGREIRTTYYHLSHVNVEPGAQVRMGDLIGRSGNSGSSGDPHLHFIIQEKVDGKWILQKNEEFDWKGVP
jgi:murein DD-endopeptidase MepM/ murein hydrolase activator NlpD